MSTKTFSIDSWNNYAKSYDSLLSLRPYKELCESISGLVSGDNRLVLDAGCGTGNIIKHLLDKGHKKVIGLDNSPSMLELALTKFQDERVQLVQTDLSKQFPLRNETCDVVVSCNVLYTMADPSLFLNEINRCLKPAGELILVTPKQGYDNGMILKAHCDDKGPDELWVDPHSSTQREETLIRKALSEAGEEVIKKMLSVAKYNREIAADTIFNFFTEDDLEKLVIESGFNMIQKERTYADQAILIIATKK